MVRPDFCQFFGYVTIDVSLMITLMSILCILAYSVTPLSIIYMFVYIATQLIFLQTGKYMSERTFKKLTHLWHDTER